jgi:hypothetical protein
VWAAAAGSASTWAVSARSAAEIPVLVPAAASQLTVYAVPLGSWLFATMGGSSMARARSAVIGAHTTPEEWRMMKPIHSAVTVAAGMMRSPSFSRSSSSTTMIGRPARRAAMAWSMVFRAVGVSGVSGAEVPAGWVAGACGAVDVVVMRWLLLCLRSVLSVRLRMR